MARGHHRGKHKWLYIKIVLVKCVSKVVTCTDLHCVWDAGFDVLFPWGTRAIIFSWVARGVKLSKGCKGRGQCDDSQGRSHIDHYFLSSVHLTVWTVQVTWRSVQLFLVYLRRPGAQWGDGADCNWKESDFGHHPAKGKEGQKNGFHFWTHISVHQKLLGGVAQKYEQPIGKAES